MPEPHPSLPSNFLDSHTPAQFLTALLQIDEFSRSFDADIPPFIHSLNLPHLQMLLAGLTIKMLRPDDAVEAFHSKVVLRRLLPHMIARTKTLASLASLDEPVSLPDDE